MLTLLMTVTLLSPGRNHNNTWEDGVSVNTEVTPVYYWNLEKYREGGNRLIFNQGSTGSSKNYSILQALITIANEEVKHITVTSRTTVHLRGGALFDFKNIMLAWHLWNDKNFNRTERTYYFPNGSKIEFFGCDDQTKVHGPRRDILYINEAIFIDYAVYKQFALRTRNEIFIDYNPAYLESWVYDLHDDKSINSRRLISTYKNARKFLTKYQIEEIERYNPELNPETGDLNMWRIYGLGQKGVAEALIYKHFNTVSKRPDNPEETIYGIDFGFNVPGAMVRVEYKDGVPTSSLVYYEKGLTATDIIRKLNEANISKTKYIYADAAAKEQIEEISRAGYNIHPAIKSVDSGIKHVKSLPFNIVADSVELEKEARHYSWKVDRNGRILDEPVKANDHAMDADRYAKYSYHMKPRIQARPRTFAGR